MELIKHLLDRHYDPTRYVNQVLYQPNPTLEGSVLTVMLFGYDRRIIGYQQYRPDVLDKKTNHPKEARYFTYLPRGGVGVFGLETLDFNQKVIYIVEESFKASSLHMLGLNALAVLTSTPKQHKEDFNRLRSLGFDLIAIGDNDKAGQSLVRTVGQGFTLPTDLDEYGLEDLKEELLYERGRAT